jgi:hypothetical protein
MEDFTTNFKAGYLQLEMTKLMKALQQLIVKIDALKKALAKGFKCRILAIQILVNVSSN